MEILKTAGIVFLCVYLLILLRLLLKTRKPFKYFVINVLSALWLYAVIELTAFATGLHIPLNWYTLSAVSFGGIPFIVLLLILRFLIF